MNTNHRRRRESSGNQHASGQYWLDAGQLAEIDERWIQIGAIAQAGVFVCPVLKHYLHVTMRGNESVRPKRNATFVEAFGDLVCGRLEDGCASDDHLKFAVHSADAS